jgi:hypothetical protein
MLLARAKVILSPRCTERRTAQHRETPPRPATSRAGAVIAALFRLHTERAACWGSVARPHTTPNTNRSV